MENGARLVVAVLVLVSLASGAVAGTNVLFPEPLHLTRVVDDPIRGGTAVIEEFYIANRVISIAGDRTVIADYDRSELTEIDRAEGTYSITPFATLAAAVPKTRHEAIATTDEEERWTIRAATRSERPGAEFFFATPKARGDIRTMEVGIDRSVRLTRDALDVIVGAAYPNDRPAEADVYVRAAAPSRDPRRPQSSSAGSNAAASADAYGLPVEQSVTYDAGGTAVVVRNRVTRVGKELPAPSLLAVPAGAKRVESQRVQTRRMLDELDVMPSAEQQP